MSPELESFLAAEDLDEVLTARDKIAALAADDEAAIRAVLGEWRKPQAVSNLLLYPALIPKDIRLSTLLRGLCERKLVYYILAAVVGFQSIDAADIVDADRQRVLADLLAVMRDTTDILAQRASVSFTGFAKLEDAPSVFALMGHANKTVRHNVRAWLFRTFQVSGVEALADAGRRSRLAENLQLQVVGEFADFLANPPQGFTSPLFPLYGYIPNLRDIDGLFATTPVRLRDSAEIDPMGAAERNRAAAVEAIENQIAQSTVARWNALVVRILPASSLRFTVPMALAAVIACVIARKVGEPFAARLMLISLVSLIGMYFLAFGAQLWLTGYLVFQFRRATNHNWLAGVGLLLYFLGGAALVALFLSVVLAGFKVQL